MPDLVARIGADISGFSSAMGQINRRAQGVADRVGAAFVRAGKTILGLSVAAGGAAASLSLLAQRGETVLGVETGFRRAVGATENFGAALTSLRASSRGMISDFELMRSSNSALQLGLVRNSTDMGRLVQAATRLGGAMGRTAADAVNDLVQGLGRGSTEVLDNLGIVLRAETAYERYAQRLGRTKESLDETEKRQAIMTIGMEEAIRRSQELGDTMPGSFARVSTAVLNARDSLSRMVAESAFLRGVFGAVAEGIGIAAGSIGDNVGRSAEDVSVAFEAMRSGAVLVASTISAVGHTAAIVARAISEAIRFALDSFSGAIRVVTAEIEFLSLLSLPIFQPFRDAMVHIRAFRADLEALGEAGTIGVDNLEASLAALDERLKAMVAGSISGFRRGVTEVFAPGLPPLPTRPDEAGAPPTAESLEEMAGAAKRAGGAVGEIRTELDRGRMAAEQLAGSMSDSLVRGSGSAADRIREVFTQLWQQLAADFLKSQILSLLTRGKLFGRIFGFADGGVTPGHVQGLAGGGIVSSPMVALAERGQPEAVVPLSGGRSIPVELQGGGQTGRGIEIGQLVVRIDAQIGDLAALTQVEVERLARRLAETLTRLVEDHDLPLTARRSLVTGSVRG